MPKNFSTRSKGGGLSQATLTGLELKEIGTQAAIDAMPEWCERARETALRIGRTRPFTSEDVTDLVGLPRDPGPNRNNAIGAVFRAMSNERLIRRTGSMVPARNPQAHGRLIAKWVLA